MKVTELPPCHELAPFVRGFELVEADAEVERTLLPDTCIIVGFRYSGSVAMIEGGSPRVLPWNTVSGIRTSARRMRTAAGSGIILAKFRELGARSFFAEPLHRLFGAVHALEEHQPAAEVACVSRRIIEAEGARERVAIFERFLLDRRVPRAADPLLSLALDAIQAEPGAIRMAVLAERLGLSQDAFEKRFRRVVGASPKAFAGIVHFRRVLEAHPRLRASLTELALETGFYDQSHFIRRFRALAGAAPSRVFGSDDYC